MEAVILVLCPSAPDHPARTPAEGVVGKARGDAQPGDSKKPAARVPCQRRSTASLREARHVPGRIEGHARPAKRELAVGGVVGRSGHWIREECAGEGTADGDAVTRSIVLVGQVAKDAGGVPVDQGGESRGHVVLVLGGDAVGEHQERAAAEGVVLDVHGVRRLLAEGAEARGGVVGIGHRGLAADRHLDAAAQRIVLIPYGPESGGLGCQPVQDVLREPARPVGVGRVVGREEAAPHPLSSLRHSRPK